MINVLTSIQLQEYRFLKVTYESLVDWRIAQNYLRCSPQFHNQPRYDFVMYESKGKLIFAQLKLVFQCHMNSEKAGQQTLALALVQPFDERIPAAERPRKDKELGLLRYRARHIKECTLIALGSIIRGALLVQDPLVPDERLVVDVIDTDMFLRLLALHRM